MKYKEYDLLVLLIIAMMTSVVLVIDAFNVLVGEPNILDGAFVFGFLYLSYRFGVSRPRD